jgi:hypothetical protein
MLEDGDDMRRRLLALTTALALIVLARSSDAQDSQVEFHANYLPSTGSNSSAWGAGGQYQLTLGSKQQPVRLSPSLGVDWSQQEDSGPSTTSVGLDVNLQPGGDSQLTPYAGGSVSANWVSKNAPKGALLGLEYMGGVYYKLEPQGSLSLHLEVRYGYVRTQEHQTTGRFGVAFSL